jgi:ribosome-binding factor A
LSTKRILKINELLKRELSQLLLKEVEFPEDVFVTITRVETSVDLREAIVSISTMPSSEAGRVRQILNCCVYDLQQEINKKLRMRPIPKIIFREEKKVSQAARIEELLEKIKKEKG